jgi:Sulfotransferase domain
LKTIDKIDQSQPLKAQQNEQSKKSTSEKVKSIARGFQYFSAQSFRRATGQMRLLPDFLIIGGQRCGTSSLYYYLTEQQGIISAATKEVHFFDDFYSRGIEWYRAQFPTRAYKYYVENVRKRHFFTGEASPYYIFHPHAPRRVSAFLPHVKLILLLRNPIDRAYSQHWLEVKGNYETLSFEDAITCEQERIAGEREKMLSDENYHSFKHRRYTYLTRGIYKDQIQHWMSYFPKEQFLMLKTEDLYTNPALIVRQTLEFLGVPGEEIDTNREYKKYKVPSKTGYMTKDAAPKMNPNTRNYLVEYFKPHNARLHEFLGRDFGWDK